MAGLVWNNDSTNVLFWQEGDFFFLRISAARRIDYGAGGVPCAWAVSVATYWAGMVP